MTGIDKLPTSAAALCAGALAIAIVSVSAGTGATTADTGARLAHARGTQAAAAGIRYPASYFTGPLGRRVPLPPRRGAFLILQPMTFGCDWSCIKAQVAAREHAAGRRFDGIANGWRPHQRGEVERWVHARGSIPIIAGWTPGGTPAEIASGARDRQIVRLARYLRRFDFVVMVRMFHEFDLAGWPHHACGQAFVDMWRRVVDVFEREKATNVGFWWSPTEGADRGCIASSYPGDAYVDWAGSGWYNWCYVAETDCWSTPLHGGWAEFGEMFDYRVPGLASQHDTWGPRKPFVVGETNTVHDAAYSAKKSTWYRGIPHAARRMRYLRGVMLFDSDVSGVEGSKANFRVDHPRSDATAYAGFVALARDPWFNTRRAPARLPRGG